jgi:Phage Terminase
MSRALKVIQFIETYCRVPEGKLVGKPFQLMKFQKDFIEDIYDNSAGTTRAYLLIARKNGKSSLIAAIALAHIVGPEAKQNTQIISGARSRDQASLVYKLAEKMVRLNPELRKIVKPIPSQKTLIGLPMHVEYKAVSAEAGMTGPPWSGPGGMLVQRRSWDQSERGRRNWPGWWSRPSGESGHNDRRCGRADSRGVSSGCRGDRHAPQGAFPARGR